MDIVYVIYYNGQIYKTRSRKTAYLEKRYAKQVISVESADIAKNEMYAKGISWYEISEDILQEHINEVRNRFEIKEFVERKDD